MAKKDIEIIVATIKPPLPKLLARLINKGILIIVPITETNF
jgi:hypothetical protein